MYIYVRKITFLFLIYNIKSSIKNVQIAKIIILKFNRVFISLRLLKNYYHAHSLVNII